MFVYVKAISATMYIVYNFFSSTVGGAFWYITVRPYKSRNMPFDNARNSMNEFHDESKIILFVQKK
jgi:hypothetical protein